MAEALTELETPLKPTFSDRFHWDEIMGITVPFIKRPEDLFAELNMLKKTLFKKHMQVLSDSIFEIACPPVDSNLVHKINPQEKAILDEINMDCDNIFSSTPYCVDSTFLLNKNDVLKLYKVLDTVYQMVMNKELVKDSKCGFLQIDNSQTPVPFVDVTDVGMAVPLFFFESPQVSKIAFLLTDYWLITYLKLCCKMLTILPNFYNHKSLWVVKLELLKTVVPDLKEVNIFRSLPSKTRLVQFLRLKSEPEEIHCPAKKILKLSETITIKDEDDEIVEETIKIKTEPSQHEIDKLIEACRQSNNVVQAPVKKLSQMCTALNSYRQSCLSIHKFGGISAASANTSKPASNSTRIRRKKANSNSISTKARARKTIRERIIGRIGSLEQETIITDTAQSLRMPQSTWDPNNVPSLCTVNIPDIEGSIPRSAGNVGFADIFMSQPSGPFDSSGAIKQMPEYQTRTMSGTPGIYTIAQQSNVMSLTTKNIPLPQTPIRHRMPLAATAHQSGTIRVTPKDGITGIKTSSSNAASGHNLLQKEISPALQERHKSLAICSPSSYATTPNMFGSLSHSSILTKPSGMSSNTPTVIQQPRSLLSGIQMQQHVKQAESFAHQPGTIIVRPGPDSSSQQSNIMVVPMDNVAHTKVDALSPKMDLQVLHTSVINNESNPVKLLHIPNSIAQSLISQESNMPEVTGKVSKSRKRQTELQDKLEILRKLQESICQSKFINILPKQISTKSEVVSPEPITNTSLSIKNIDKSEALVSPQINYLPLIETVNNASNLNNVLILEPNNVTQSDNILHGFPSNVPNSSIVNISPHNNIMPSSGRMIAYQNGYIENLGSIIQAPSSVQILNQSGFIVSSNNMLGSSNCILTAQPNMFNGQNIVIATSNGLMLCPSLVTSPSGEQIKQSHGVQPSNVASQNNLNNISFKTVSAQPFPSINSAYRSDLNNVISSIVTKQTNIGLRPNNLTNKVTPKNSNVKKPSKFPTSDSDVNKTHSKRITDHARVVVTHLNNLTSYSSNTIGKRTHEGTVIYNDDIKIESNDIQDVLFIDTNNVLIKNNPVIQPDLKIENIGHDGIKIEPDELKVKSKKCSLDVIDLTDEDGIDPPQEAKKDICTIISDENMEKLVMLQGLGEREVLYKVHEIPDFESAKVRTYKVVSLIIQKCHSFFCISMNPLHHDNLLISVMEIIEKLFPDFTPKTFMAIAKEMKLELYSLNPTQRTVLQRFYAMSNSPDVSGHLYFLYKKFIVLYETIKRVSEKVLKMLPAGQMNNEKIEDTSRQTSQNSNNVMEGFVPVTG